MTRIVINSSLPLRAAAQYRAGRQVVVPTPGHALALSGTPITPPQLPSALLPSEDAFTCALRRAARNLDLQGDLGALRGSLTELLTRTPVDRAAMCAESRTLAALWTAFKAELPPSDPNPASPEGPLLILGFTALSELEWRTLSAAACDDSVLILPPIEGAGTTRDLAVLEQLGWTVEQEAFPSHPDVGERLATRFMTGRAMDMTGVTLRAAADLHQECAAALAWISALSGEALLIVPDLALYAPELGAVAWDLGLTLDLPLERPLADTRLGAWLAELFRVLSGDWSGPGVRRVLSHPLASGVTPALLQAAARARPGRRAAWLDLGLPQWLREWPEQATYEQFTEQILNLLGEIDPARLTPEDSRAGQQLLDELDDLTAQTQDISLHDFAGQALLLLKDPLPSQPGVGLPVRTPETALRRFDHVAILGLSEGLLPAPPAAPPLLDFHDRRQLQQGGVQCLTALDAVQARDIAFWGALGTARQSLSLSWPQRLGKRQQQPSAYLTRLGLTVPDGQPVTVPDAAQTPPAADPVILGGDIGLPFVLEDHTFSATQLTRFSQCPYRWYAQHALGLSEQEENGAQLLPQERGRFNHRVLELVGRAAKDQPDPRAAMLDQFQVAFEQAEAEQGLPRRAAWPQQRPELHRRLQRALGAPEFIAAGAIVIGVEQSFDTRWNGLRVTGKIDRIDQVSGALLITDYKSGSSLQGGQGGSRDVQLNLYLDVAAVLYPDFSSASGQYLSLSNTEKRVLGRVQRQQGVLDDLLTDLRGAALTGRFPVRPGSYCGSCPLPALCRQSAVTGEDA